MIFYRNLIRNLLLFMGMGLGTNGMGQTLCCVAIFSFVCSVYYVCSTVRSVIIGDLLKSALLAGHMTDIVSDEKEEMIDEIGVQKFH